MGKNKFEVTSVDIRTYFNNPNIYDQITRVLSWPIYECLIVVNAAQHQNLREEFMDKTIAFKDKRLRVLLMETGYNWSAALNEAWRAIVDNDNVQYMFNLSTEAWLTQEQAATMLHEFNDANVGIVGTTFNGIYPDGKPADLGLSYKIHVRDTALIASKQALLETGHGYFDKYTKYDTWCDSNKGQEDCDLSARMHAETGRIIKILDLKANLLVGVNHDQPTKEANELWAIEQIIKRLREKYLVDSIERIRLEGEIFRINERLVRSGSKIRL